VENVEHDRSSGVYSVGIGIRIDDEDGNFIGVMKVVLNIEEVVRIIKSLEASKKYLTRKIKIITADGRLVYSTEEFKFLEDVSDELVLRYGHTKDPADKLYSIETNADGKEKLFAHTFSKGYKDFKGLDWVLTAEYETEEIFAPIIKLKNTLLLISFVVTILAVLLGLYISYSIFSPITKLKNATVEIGKGNLNYKTGMTSKDEIGQLSRAFDKMTDDLKQTTTSIATLSEEILTRRKIEQELKTAKQQIEFILGVTKTGFDIIDSDFNVVYVDPEWQKTYGDYKGKKCYAYYNGRDRVCPDCGVVQALRIKKPIIKEKVLPKEGNRLIQITTIPFQNEKGEWFAAEVNVDITERKKIQEQLRQFEKMVSLGRLSASIAHELKNPLAIILQSTAYLKSKSLSDTKINNVIKMTEQSALKVNAIVEDLLHFARQTPSVLKKADISSIIEDTILLVEYQAKDKNIKIVKQYHGAYFVNIDTRQIQQVFINVLLNALDAIDNKGTITISLKQVKDVQNYIQVIFTDSGCGISKEQLQNVFDPFFSTKRKKGNAGLGLSISQEIVEMHKGTITIDSQVGIGTSVIINLPIS